MRGLVPGLAVAAVVQHQHPLVVRCGRGIVQQQLHAALVDLVGIPGCLRHKPLQPLHGAVLGADDWFGAGQRGQGLVAVAGQQQALQTGTEAAALRQRAEQGIELGGVALQGAGCRWAGKALGHRDHLSSGVTPQPTLPTNQPDLTNYH
jgi:hypothetical protein